MPQIELNQSLYKQLAQHVSESDDDDSEDEVIRFQTQPRSAANPQGVSATAMYSPKLDNHPILVTPRTEQQMMYLNVAETNGVNGRGCNILLDLDGGVSTSDTVAILNEGVNSTISQDDDASTGHIIGMRKPMSPCRKVCFGLSIFVCFASVVIFLWGLPCNNELTCPARKQAGRLETSHNWIRDFEEVEFKSVISVTRNGAEDAGRNVIFMYRGDKIFEKTAHHQSHHNGILSLVGTGGAISWYDQMGDEPSTIDCGLLDVDKNGIADCLVIDEYGQLGCIDPVSGTWIWHISLYTPDNNSTAEKGIRRKAIDLLDFPLMLPDLDNDSVLDLLLVTSLEQVHHNNFLFVSGAHGRPIGKAYQLDSCEFIHKLQLDGPNLFFNCINNETELTKILLVAELFKLATDGKELAKQALKTESIPQHKFYGQRKHTQSQRNIYSNGVADLIVENSGKCPLNCTMSISVGVIEAPPKVVINGTGMYGMVPAVLIPKRRKGKDSHSGFVIKFWEWVEERSPGSSSDKVADEIPRVKRDTLSTPSPNINWTFVKKERWTVPVDARKVKRDVTATHDDYMKDLVRRNLKEHVILILFNGTSNQVINTSQSNVIQFCREAPGTEIYCQPDTNYQENSMTIADLSDDSQDQELISFYSTFVESQTNTKKFKLVTYVQKFRLEKDLVSLYDT